MVRLPDPLYQAAKSLSARHARWHEARDPERLHLRGPGTEFPEVFSLEEAGSGEQFLLYHRAMLQEFSKASRLGDRHQAVCQPWREVPYWLSQFFSWAQPGYLSGALTRIRQLAETGSPDDLGRFLERHPSAENPFQGLHEVSHTMISIYERHRFGVGHPSLENAGMASAATSPHNEHFWGLHGWIDDLYAQTLRRRSRP